MPSNTTLRTVSLRIERRPRLIPRRRGRNPPTRHPRARARAREICGRVVVCGSIVQCDAMRCVARQRRKQPRRTAPQYSTVRYTQYNYNTPRRTAAQQGAIHEMKLHAHLPACCLAAPKPASIPSRLSASCRISSAGTRASSRWATATGASAASRKSSPAQG